MLAHINMYAIARQKETRRNYSNIDLKEHALFVHNDCLFILPIFRNLGKKQ